MNTKGSYDYYVYILTNKNKTVLYTGVTNSLRNRLYYHNNPKPNTKAFSNRYNVHYLVYYEHYNLILGAIAREKQIKGLSRKKKEALIDTFNPSWAFLNDSI